MSLHRQHFRTCARDLTESTKPNDRKGRRLPLAIPMNERLLVTDACSKAAIPGSATTRPSTNPLRGIGAAVEL